MGMGIQDFRVSSIHINFSSAPRRTSSLDFFATRKNILKKDTLSIGSAPPLLWKYRTRGHITASPAVIDINGDKKPELVVTSDDGNVYALNGANGTLIWKFQPNPNGYLTIDTSPTIGDLDNDGKPEIVIGIGLSGEDNKIYALNGEDGSILWSFQDSHFYGSGMEYGSTALGDIDGDGKLEVVFGITSPRQPNFYALNGEDGSVLWKINVPDASIEASPAIGNLNGDTGLDIVFQASGVVRNGYSSSDIYALDGKTGSILWFRNFTIGTFFSSPALLDIDKDGSQDVFIASGDGAIRALSGKDGTILWVYKTDDSIASSVAIGDVDVDGKPEVIVGTYKYVCALNAEDGSVSWRYFSVNGYSSPALGDIDGDRKLDVLIGRWDGKIHAINGEDGSALWAFQTAGGVVSSPALADLDGDGKLEIAVGSEDGTLYVLDPPNAGSRVYWQGDGGTLSFNRTRNIKDIDRDLDFLSDVTETSFAKTDPLKSDTDGDELPDGWEFVYGLNPLSANDAAIDTDSDGLSNLEEYQLGLDPTNPDTDNDGATDGEETGEFLLDPKNPWLNPATRLIILLTSVLMLLFNVLGGLFFFFDKYKQRKRKRGKNIILESKSNVLGDLASMVAESDCGTGANRPMKNNDRLYTSWSLKLREKITIYWLMVWYFLGGGLIVLIFLYENIIVGSGLPNNDTRVWMFLLTVVFIIWPIFLFAWLLGGEISKFLLLTSVLMLLFVDLGGLFFLFDKYKQRKGKKDKNRSLESKSNVLGDLAPVVAESDCGTGANRPMKNNDRLYLGWHLKLREKITIYWLMVWYFLEGGLIVLTFLYDNIIIESRLSNNEIWAWLVILAAVFTIWPIFLFVWLLGGGISEFLLLSPTAQAFILSLLVSGLISRIGVTEWILYHSKKERRKAQFQSNMERSR